MSAGISLSVAAVTKLGTQDERQYLLEVGVWPYKSKGSRVWLSLFSTGEGRSDSLRTWGFKLPSVEGKLDGLANRIRRLLGWETTDV